MEENNKEIGGQGENNSTPPSNDKHTSGRVLMAGAVAAGAIGGALATGGDVSAQTKFDIEENIPPKTEMVTGESFKNPDIQEVERENLPNAWGSFADSAVIKPSTQSQNLSEMIIKAKSLNTPKNEGEDTDPIRRIIEEKGGVLLGEPDLQFQIISPLGATGSDGVFYQYALGQGTKISIPGVADLEVDYSEKNFKDGITFLNSYPDGILAPGHIFPYMYFIPQGKEITMSNFAETHGGTQMIRTKIGLAEDEFASVLIPIVISGRPSSINLPMISDGKIIGSTPPTYKGEGLGITGESELSNAFLYGSLGYPNKESGSARLIVHGICDYNSLGGGFYVNDKYFPEVIPSQAYK